MLAGGLAVWINRHPWRAGVSIDFDGTKIDFSSFSPDGSKIITRTMIPENVYDATESIIHVWQAEAGKLINCYVLSKYKYASRPVSSPRGPLIALVGVEAEPLCRKLPSEIEAIMRRKITIKLGNESSALKQLNELEQRSGLKISIGPEFLETIKMQTENTGIQFADEMEVLFVFRWLCKALDAEWIFQDGKLTLVSTYEWQSILEAERTSTVRIFDMEQGKEVGMLYEKNQPVIWTGFSSNGKFLMTAHQSGMVRLWDTDGFDQKAAIEFTANTNDFFPASVSADGLVLAAVLNNQLNVLCKNAPNPRRIQSKNRFMFVSVLPCGERLMTRDDDGLCQIWDIKNGNCLLSINSDYYSFGPPLQFSANGTRFLSKNGLLITLHDGGTGMHLKQYAINYYCGQSSPFPAMFSPDGKWFAGIFYGDAPRIHSAEDGRLLCYLEKTDWLSDLETIKEKLVSVLQNLNPKDVAKQHPFSPPPPMLAAMQDLGAILTISADGNRILENFEPKRMQVWLRLRPEAWYGFFVLPEAWLTLVAFLLLPRSIWKDRLYFRRSAVEGGADDGGLACVASG
jgi:WD40 repeat protein